MVSRHLLEKYGDKISIRSAVIKPPTQQITREGGEERISYKGSVSFNVIDRQDKDFGRHKMIYVIQDRSIHLEEDES